MRAYLDSLSMDGAEVAVNCLCSTRSSASTRGLPSPWAAPTLSMLMGSNVYEVSHWLWMFGRGKPRLGGLSVAETAVRC